MNDITKNGFYTVVNPVSDGPGFSPISLLVIGNNGNYCVQVACALTIDGISVRRLAGGAWSPWRNITMG